jgi:hypothetical protein
MLTLKPHYLTQQMSRLLASRYLLHFLFVPQSPKENTHYPFDDLFSVDSLPDSAFTDASELFLWKTRKIYDVDGLELFRDHSIDLDGENEIRVRVAASDWLGTPVWSVRAGRKYVDRLAEKTLAFIKSESDLKPVFNGDGKIMIVCYSYPKLGILCESGRDIKEKVVVDLADPIIIPVDKPEEPKYPSLKTAWSPYDDVTRARIGYNRWLWKRNTASLPKWRTNRENLRQEIIMMQTQNAPPRYTDPKLNLVPQQNDYYCAPATFLMILEQRGEDDLTQEIIGAAMNTSDETGTTLSEQESSIEELAPSLVGELEYNESFSKARDEIDANRPLKSGTVTDHARACGGYKVASGINSLRIYNPWPSNEGDIEWEPWNSSIHENFVYVKDA